MTALGQIHAAVRDLGLDDHTKRAVYRRVTGKRSAAEMDEGERRAVVDELRRQGASQGARRGRKALSGKYAKKLQALWIAGWNLGLVRNRDDAALLAFVKRQTGLDHMRFLQHADDAAKAIEALKAWLARDGGVDWTPDRLLPDWGNSNGYRIALAQWEVLAANAREYDRPEFWPAVYHLLGNRQDQPEAITPANWIVVMNQFGRRIRAIKASA